MRVPKIKMDKTHPLKGIFWGKEEAFEYIPITSYKQSGDTLFVEKYIDDGVTEPLEIYLHNNKTFTIFDLRLITSL